MSVRIAALFCLMLASPAFAAEQWAPVTKTKVWSEVTTTERRSLVNEPLSAAIKPEARLVGSWSVRIPSAVSYYSKEAKVYRRLTPGADMSRLVVQASGAYRWGKTSGKLRAIKPWFAQPGVRYFEARNAQGAYILYAKSAKELVVLFDVGGFAAKGTRLR